MKGIFYIFHDMKAAGLTFPPTRKLCWLTREKLKVDCLSSSTMEKISGHFHFSKKVLIELMSLRCYWILFIDMPLSDNFPNNFINQDLYCLLDPVVLIFTRSILAYKRSSLKVPNQLLLSLYGMNKNFALCVKFMFSKKATKIDQIFTVDLTFIK